MKFLDFVFNSPRRMRRIQGWMVVLFLCFLSQAATAATFFVEMRNIQFQPANIVINQGDTVTWTNRDSQAHDTVSGTNLVPSGFWASPLLPRAGTFSFTFNIPPGSYGYYCTPHVQLFGMRGTVTVNATPTVGITSPNNGATVPAGLPFAVTASASDADGNVTRVDFFADGNLIGSSSGPTFSVNATLPAGPHTLTAVAVDNRNGTGTSAAINVVAADAPAILSGPQSTNVLEGGSVEFTVIATGDPPLTYQWQFNGADILGATNTALLISNVTTNDQGDYTVIVRNLSASVTSAPATLAVTGDQFPTVTLLQPTNANAIPPNFNAFPIGGQFELLATAEDPDGFITRVEFLVTNSFAGTNFTLVLSNAPYVAVVGNLVEGTYQIVARAVDDKEAFRISSLVTVVVPSLPGITITAPVQGQHFPLGQAIGIQHQTFDNTFEQRIEDFANGQLIPTNASFIPSVPGPYTLTAIVTDRAGQRATSAPVTIRVFAPDSVKPTVTITNSPPNFARLTNAEVVIAGIATDNIGVEGVEIVVDGVSVTNVTGSNVWSARVPLRAGQNTIRVRSFDFALNFSAEVSRVYTRMVSVPLTVQTNGQGKVVPNLNNKPLEIGKVYSMTAYPAAGSIFVSWGGAPFQGTRLNFTMQSNLVLTANFMTNPFPRVQGTYSGLLSEMHEMTPQSSGAISLQVGTLGAFSGRLNVGGAAFALNGKFSPMGEWHTALLRAGRPPLAVKLQLDMTNGTDTVVGSVTDGMWMSEILANRNVFNAVTNRAPAAGSRTFGLFLFGNPTNQVARVTSNIAAGGAVTAAVTLNSGRRFSISATLAKDGDFPFYIPIATNEVMIGWLNFSPPPVTVTGEISWMRSGTGAFSVMLEP